MIKKTLFTFGLMLAFMASAIAGRTGKMSILGIECNYDTIGYRTIAPGATLLQLKFNNIPNGYYQDSLMAHIIEIDMTNEYNRFSTKLSKNKFYQWNTIRNELREEQKEGRKAVASITGFEFIEASNKPSPVRMEGEVTGSMISDGTVYYHNKSSDLTYYYNNEDRLAYVGNTHMYARIDTDNDTWPIAQVNRFRDLNGNNSDITLFCNGIKESRVSDANKASGKDVIVKILDGSKKIIAGKMIECQVISVLDGGGHKFDDGEAILSGANDAATKLSTLTPGQKINITVDILDDNNNRLYVEELAPKFYSHAIANGQIGNGGIFEMTNYAIGILGVSEDNKKTYIAVMDNDYSQCSCKCFADMMRNLGVYNGMFLDGGPSIDMAVDDDVISHNLCSNIGGRDVGSCYMLYSTAPNDDNIVKLETDDNTTRIVEKGSEIILNVWGYNQYGEMVRKNVVDTYDITVTCTNNIGTVQGNKFTATKEGTGEIIYTTNSNYTLRIPVTVTNNKDTGIGSVTKNDQASDTNAQTYTLNGQRIKVKPNHQGIVVQKGKKSIIR